MLGAMRVSKCGDCGSVRWFMNKTSAVAETKRRAEIIQSYAFVHTA